MTVQEINQVHQRYIELSNTFRSAWTFHQFLEGLRKVYPEEGPDGYEADFQSVYRQLKAISENLNELGAETASDQLDEMAKQLQLLLDLLQRADEQVAPAHLRQFFERVRNYDDGILQQLVKFYLYICARGTAWSIDRLNKADFLATRLVEEIEETTEVYVLRDPGYVRELSASLWLILSSNDVSEAEVASASGDIESIRLELSSIDTIEELSSLGLVQRYREIKHALGSTLFHPDVLRTVLETNLALKNRVRELYAREELRIVAEYQQIFELEREVPHSDHLREELASFREAVERFESQLQLSNIRLEALADIQRRVRALLPQLQAVEDTGIFAQPPTDQGLGTPPELKAEFEEVRDVYDRMIEALGNTNPSADPKKVTLEPEVFGFGLEPREVIAFRRIVGEMACDRGFENLLLGAAALRVKTLEAVDEIKSIWDDTAFTKEGPQFDIARRVLRIGDRTLRRFDHLVEQAMMAGEVEEARLRKILAMRLMRIYSGLWLMVHRA